MRRTGAARIVAAVVAAAAVTAGAAVLLHMPQTQRIPAADDAARLAYLRSQGREGTLVRAQAVVIPETWPGTYAAYAQAQAARQLPLAAAAGQPGTLYTYALAGSDERAALLVWDGILVGYQVYGDP